MPWLSKIPGFGVLPLLEALKRASLSLAPIAALATWFTAGQASVWNLLPLTVVPLPGLQVLPHLVQCCKSVTSFISPPIQRARLTRTRNPRLFMKKGSGAGCLRPGPIVGRGPNESQLAKASSRNIWRKSGLM